MARGSAVIDTAVQRTRAWTGFFVVATGDVAIAVAAALAVFEFGSTDANTTQIVAILTAAFTAVSTMTAAYFGIRAASNTAQSAVAQQVAALAPQGPPAPTVTNIDPRTGSPAGGTEVVITGTALTGATAVRFGMEQALFKVDSERRITARSPAGTGTVDITVETAGGTSASTAEVKFTFA